MKDISDLKENQEIQKLLGPMLYILDKKNITEGINYVSENGKLYICFDKEYLSETNKIILEKISFIYSETIFYSDNSSSPNSDRLEYWCPDDDYDKNYHVTERIKNKKMFVLELDLNNPFNFVGITIMLANSLQEQDPIALKIYEMANVLPSDLLERHQHYLDAEVKDSDWIQLTISLNKDNPLHENWYAPFIGVCEINTPVSCDNMLLAVMVGNHEKRCIEFNMERENLEQAIKSFLEREFDFDNCNNNNLTEEIQKRLVQH